MPRSATELVNMALGHLEQTEQMTSFEDGTNVATQAQLHYAQTRDEILRLCDWSFATRFTTVSKLPNAIGDWRYAYAVPKDCIKLRRTFRQLEGRDAGSYLREEEQPNYDLAFDEVSQFQAILSDVEISQIEYTKRVSDAAVYDPLFVDALTNRLAIKMAGGLRGIGVDLESLMRKSEYALARARTHSMRERNRARAPRAPWIQARHG